MTKFKVSDKMWGIIYEDVEILKNCTYGSLYPKYKRVSRIRPYTNYHKKEEIIEHETVNATPVVNTIEVPTGKIFTFIGERNLPLECLTVADYGREKNCKARFLGLNNDISGVENGTLMPLSKKWVITVSSQYGCSMGCKFCDVPKVGKGKNVTCQDISNQILTAIHAYPTQQYTERLNIHFARMGEPTFNTNVLDYAYHHLCNEVSKHIFADTIHPVVSTMMPKNNTRLEIFLLSWCAMKNDVYDGEAGLQISINTTDEDARQYMFSENSLSLLKIAKLCGKLPYPNGRKYALNFAINSQTVIDAKLLVKMFDPDKFMVKLTPIHNTASCKSNGIAIEGYSAFDIYRKPEEELVQVGFDVLVFVPSEDEERGRITCGNAVLANNQNK